MPLQLKLLNSRAVCVQEVPGLQRRRAVAARLQRDTGGSTGVSLPSPLSLSPCSLSPCSLSPCSRTNEQAQAHAGAVCNLTARPTSRYPQYVCVLTSSALSCHTTLAELILQAGQHACGHGANGY